MPRNGSGIYALPAGNPVIDGTTIDVAWANPTMADIAVQMNNVLTRDGLLGPTVPLLAVDGSASLPGYAFGAQPSTGIFRTGAGLCFSYAGTERMRLDATGNLGIGTASGGARLNVNGGAGTSQIRFEVNSAAFVQEVSTNAAVAAYVRKENDASQHVWKLSSSEAMRLDATGNLGIGTASSAYRLGVTTNLSTTVAEFASTASGDAAFIGIKSSAGTYAYIGTVAGALQFQTPGSGYATKMTLDSTGNLGIGITPSAWGNGVSMQGIAWSLSTGLGSDDTILATNARQTSYGGGGTNFVYRNTAPASTYNQVSGSHIWRVAPSGTAGNPITFTQAMTLSAAGVLSVGTGTGLSATGVDVSRATGLCDVGIYANDTASGTANAQLRLYSGGPSGGDPIVNWEVTGGSRYYMGIDNSVSDRLVIGAGYAPGAADFVTIENTGAVTIANLTSTNLTATTSATAPTRAAGDNTTNVATTAFVRANDNPVGTIIDYAGTTAPTGYLACPLVATNISRTTYAALFAAIGTTWGAGDGSTTFGCPWFPANYAAVQANANVGTATVGQNLAHTHTASDGSGFQTTAAGVAYGSSTTGSSSSATTSSDGGTANLAAGHRILKCVKI